MLMIKFKFFHIQYSSGDVYASNFVTFKHIGKLRFSFFLAENKIKNYQYFSFLLVS